MNQRGLQSRDDPPVQRPRRSKGLAIEPALSALGTLPYATPMDVVLELVVTMKPHLTRLDLTEWPVCGPAPNS